jgi:hypothetical protein
MPGLVALRLVVDHPDLRSRTRRAERAATTRMPVSGHLFGYDIRHRWIQTGYRMQVRDQMGHGT